MIIYGLNPVLEALRSHPDRVHYVGVAREHGGKLQRAVAEARRAGVPVRQLTGEQIDRLAGRGVHNGVVADVSEGSPRGSTPTSTTSSTARRRSSS